MTSVTTDPRANALRNATIIGTVLQLIMVISGHWVEWIKLNGFAFGGVGISLLAGVIYARNAGLPRMASARGGMIAGGLCAILGIGVSYALGDVPLATFAIGAVSSSVTGAIGGAIGAKRG